MSECAMRMLIRSGLIATVILGLIACGGETDKTGSAIDTSAADTGTTQPPGPVTCSVKPYGAVATSAADIIYQNNVASATGTHLAGSGGLASLDMMLEINDGCRLSVHFTKTTNGWELDQGTLDADTNCGGFWPEEGNGNYVLDKSNSLGSLMNLPDKVDYPDADESCAQVPELKLVGNARFMAGEDMLEVNLSGITLKGSVHSTKVDDGHAPGAYVSCEGVSCGDDLYGVYCGGCDESLTCAAGVCQESACLPEGDGNASEFAGLKGKCPQCGNHIGDITWTDRHGNEVNLHDFCDAPAVWIIKTTGW